MTATKILAIGVVSPVGSKGDLAQYRASVDQLKKLGEVKLCYPRAEYDYGLNFFEDIELLPHPSEITLPRSLSETLGSQFSSASRFDAEPFHQPSLGMRFMGKISSFYNGSFTLKLIDSLLTKSLFGQLHSDFPDAEFAVILGHTLEKSLMSIYATSYSYPKFVLKKPTAIFPFSVSQLGLERSPRWIVKLIKMMLRRIDFLFLREERSYKYLASVIGPRKSLFNVADTAFLLSEASTCQVVSDVRRLGIDIEKPSIAVALRPDYFLTYPEHYGPVKFSLLLKKIAELLDRLILKFDAFVYFVPMTVEPSGSAVDDLTCSKECIRYMENPKRACILNTLQMDAYEVKTFLGLMDFLITTRLHAGILATSKQVPTILILPASDNKALGVSERLGIKEYFIDLNYAIEMEPEQLFQKVSNAINNCDAIRERLRMTIPREQELARIPMAVLRKFMV